MKQVSFEYIAMFQIIRSVQKFCSSGLCIFYIASAFCTGLVLFRTFYTGNAYFAFLLWNLFLAWLPYVFARKFSVEENHLKRMLLGFAWLLFFPNAPYIITDFVHLRNDQNLLFWFDLVMLFSFSLTGLVLGLASLRRIHERLSEKLSFVRSWVLVSGLIFLSGFGIYLGRELRFNSWDVVTAPVELAEKIYLTTITAPGEAVAFTTIFSSLIFFSYVAFLVLRRRSSIQ